MNDPQDRAVNTNGGDGNDDVDDFTSSRQFSWYLTFISIVFGVFISVWVQPLTTLFGNGKTEQELVNAFLSKDAIRGALMFHILICLWWWYGIFLGRIDPARTFFKFGYDFLSLCGFAIAFRFWDNAKVFPFIVFFAAALMFIRFGFALLRARNNRKAVWALGCALGILFCFIAFAAGMGFTIFMFEINIDEIENIIEFGVMALLGMSIFITVIAVTITEGLAWNTPQRWYIVE